MNQQESTLDVLNELKSLLREFGTQDYVNRILETKAIINVAAVEQISQFVFLNNYIAVLVSIWENRENMDNDSTVVLTDLCNDRNLLMEVQSLINVVSSIHEPTFVLDSISQNKTINDKLKNYIDLIKHN